MLVMDRGADVAKSTYSVNALSEIKFPWLVRRKMRTMRKKNITGLIIYGIIKTGPRSVARTQARMGVGENDRLLGFCSANSFLPKLIPLRPGVHELLFIGRSTSFRKSMTLKDGDAVVAICEPAHSWALFAEKSDVDKWWIGIIDPTRRMCSME